MLFRGCPSPFFLLFPWKLTCEFSTVLYIHYSSLAKNLSSSSASLKKLRPGAVLTSTQFRANTNKHVHMRTCLFLFARNWVEVSTAPGPSFLKLFLNFLKLFDVQSKSFKELRDKRGSFVANLPSPYLLFQWPLCS